MEHTTTLAVMQSTINFQASFVGDSMESVDRFTTQVTEHMKECQGTQRGYRKALEDTNERITRRRGEGDDLSALVRIDCTPASCVNSQCAF